MKTKLGSTRVKVVLAAAAALGLTIAAAPTAMAQQALAPAVTVTPATDLPANEDVTAEISGFEPESVVFVQQCAQIEPGVSGCDVDGSQEVTLDEQGAGTADLTVNRVFEAHDQNGELIGQVDCASVEHDPACFVGAANPQGGAMAEITFAEE